MRIIGGEFRSRRLVAPRGTATRPTSDRLRETLFNVLGPRLAEARFLDLYAGAGAVGLEALSRGARFCCFAERAPAAMAAIRENAAALKLPGDRWRLETRAVARTLEELRRAGEAFDAVFLDPPYEATADYAETLSFLGADGRGLLRPGAVVVAEHARRMSLPDRVGALGRTRLLEQGDAGLSFYADAPVEPQVEATQT